ncbi:hypothetical protein BGZ49_000425 [Haplosporangium sp. Z 27]|nr:hypothetical protein BGZ49_000425 [Haplosporangium sp. Z 27]
MSNLSCVEAAVEDTYSQAAAVTIPDNQICWSVKIQVLESTAKEYYIRSSGWGADSINSIMDEYKYLPCPFGGTMKDLFDATSNDLISKFTLMRRPIKPGTTDDQLLVMVP